MTIPQYLSENYSNKEVAQNLESWFPDAPPFMNSLIKRFQTLAQWEDDYQGLETQLANSESECDELRSTLKELQAEVDSGKVPVSEAKDESPCKCSVCGSTLPI